MKIYDRIGDTYDTTRSADPMVLDGLKQHVGLSAVGRYLDIGCGSGNYTAALANTGGQWTGLDPSARMLAMAQEKSSAVRWVQGQAEALPFDDHAFDGMTGTFCIHHFADLSRACDEFSRVLRPGGRLVLMTATPEQVMSFWLARYFPDMIRRDANQLPSLAQITTSLATSRLCILDVQPFFVTDQTQDFFFFSGKYRPDMYLSDTIRNGISCFRTRVSDAELASGLALLRQDINDGSIADVIEQHENELGEYCFVVIG